MATTIGDLTPEQRNLIARAFAEMQNFGNARCLTAGAVGTGSSLVTAGLATWDQPLNDDDDAFVLTPAGVEIAIAIHAEDAKAEMESNVISTRVAADTAAEYLAHVTRDPASTSEDRDRAREAYQQASDAWLATLLAARAAR